MQQRLQLVERHGVVTVLRRAAAATEPEAFGADVLCAASLMLDAPRGVQQALMERGAAAVLSAALVTGLRIFLRTRAASTSSSAVGKLCTGISSLCDWLPAWLGACSDSSTPAASKFASEVAADGEAQGIAGSQQTLLPVRLTLAA
jgi:hypothetical protein